MLTADLSVDHLTAEARKILALMSDHFKGRKFESAEITIPGVQFNLWFFGNAPFPGEAEKLVTSLSQDFTRCSKLDSYGGVDTCFLVTDDTTNLSVRVIRCYDIFADTKPTQISFVLS